MSHEHYSARRHPEFVVLEIGEELGALIVHTDAAMRGVEIEISLAGEDERRSHKEVVERVAGGRSEYTALFDQLPAGRYTLWLEGVACVRGVEVSSGRIAELNWPHGALTPAA